MGFSVRSFVDKPDRGAPEWAADGHLGADAELVLAARFQYSDSETTRKGAVACNLRVNNIRMMQNTAGSHSSKWFALRTKSNRESVVTEALAGRDLEAWCPRYSVSNSPAAVGKPVFPGYLFCRFNVHDRLPVLTVPGILNIVSNGKTPLSIDEREIESLRLLMESFLPVAPHEFFRIGDRVRITDGPLTGVQGYVAQHQRQHLVVCITLLQRAVSVVLEPHWLEKASQLAA